MNLTSHFPSFRDFGPAFQRTRTERGHNLREAGRAIGFDPNDLRALECGDICPNSETWKRIVSYMPSMSRFQVAVMNEKNRRKEESEKEQVPPPPQAPRVVPARPPVSAPVTIPKRTFADALFAARKKAKLSQSELADLLKVTPGAIGWWEGGTIYPIQEHYKALLLLFPELRDAPEPPSLDKRKPEKLGPRPGTGMSEPERHQAAAEHAETIQTIRSEEKTVERPTQNTRTEETKRNVIDWSRTLLTFHNSPDRVQAGMKTLLSSAHAMGFSIPELLEVLNEGG